MVLFGQMDFHYLLILSLTSAALAMDANVLDTAANNGCSNLVKLIDQVGLTSVLKSAKDVTLFAPSDAAFAALPSEEQKSLNSNKTMLHEVLKFHVVSGIQKSSGLKNDELLPTLTGSMKLRINIYNGGKVITAEGSPVSKADLQASNGLVHVIDKVIYPIPILNIPLFVTFDKDLNNFGYMMYQAKMIDTLKDEAFTVFAPTNTAIEKIPGQEYNNLLMNFTALTNFIKLHVVKGTVYSAGLIDGQAVTTLQGAELPVEVTTTGVRVDGVSVSQADIQVSNGVIHIIDSFLTPPKKASRLGHGSIPILG